MSQLRESELTTRVGKVKFNIDLTGLSEHHKSSFHEVKLLGPLTGLRVSNFNSLESIHQAIGSGFEIPHFMGEKALVRLWLRFVAFNEWLAQLTENGAKNITIKARTFIYMKTAERDERAELMKIPL